MIEEDLTIEEIVEKIGNQLEECAELLLSCEEQNKDCKKCKNKTDCLIFIRSVLASLCKMEAARIFVGNGDIEEGIYI